MVSKAAAMWRRPEPAITVALAVIAVGLTVGAWLISSAWLLSPPPGASYVPGAMPASAQPLQPVPPTGLGPASALPPAGAPAAPQVATAHDLAAIITDRRDEVYNDPETPVGGNPVGDVSVVEFFDYNCPYCREVAAVLEELQRIDPGVRLVYKEFPILGSGSALAARAALAAHRQGKYLEFHRAVMMGGRPATERTVIDAARLIDLDLGRLKVDMQDPAIGAAIARNLQLARALRIVATPTFIIDDEIYQGAADE
jgi:protein-disulfide isomerase